MHKLAAAAALAAVFAAPVQAQTVLKVHSFSGPQAPDQALHLFPWAEKINKEAGGKMKVEVYTNMQLGGKPADLPQQDSLAIYNQVDLALDPHPFTGSTTTFEALWMGVPVVTWVGACHHSRVGRSILEQVGLGGIARWELVESNANILRRLWSEDNVSYTDDHYDFDAATLRDVVTERI